METSMCIIVAKQFDDSWNIVKNRCRNYLADVTFKRVKRGDLEIMYFLDSITQYMEGFNSAGISILSASLQVLDDEKEIETRSKTPSKDGAKIAKALTYPDLKAAAMSLIKSKLTGHTFITDGETLYLLEGAWKKGGYKKQEYEYRIRKAKDGEIIVRTNHGVDLEWAGYQRGVDKNQDMSRISSECRKLIAEKVAKDANTVMEILDGLTVNHTNNPQLNPTRTTTDAKKMRTTSQTLIVPKDNTMIVRPIQSKVTIDFNKLHNIDAKTFVEILSNRIPYGNLKNIEGKPSFKNL